MLDSLLSAPVLAFVLAVAAGLARFEVRLPEALPPVLATFLLFAIGLKGGRSLSEVAPTGRHLEDLNGPSVRLETIVSVEVAEAIPAHLAAECFGRFAVVAWMTPSRVLRPERF